MAALQERFGNSTDVPGPRTAYPRIEDKLAESAASAYPLIMLGRTVVTSRRITGVTFSQDPLARYACPKPRA